MRRVLIVTPNWPPIACPDMHRVRMSLPYFSENNWEPLILKIDPSEQEGIKDSLLEKSIPSNILTWQSGCLPKRITKLLGINNVGLRSFLHLKSLGSSIIETAKPELVFFSTTMFPLFTLGRYWQRKHGIPYILDFQDPWVSYYYNHLNSSAPPGGNIKYYLSQLVAQNLESFTLRQSNHVVSVSPEYPKTLCARYPWLKEDQFTILPFGAPESDFDLLSSLCIRQSIFDPSDGYRHWVYVGRGGSDMAFALRILFLAIRSERDRNPTKWNSVKLHFVGTCYAPSDQAIKTVEPLAQEIGIADLVEEHTDRLPYFEALQVLIDSDGILLIGSDDPSYTASKLYPCILAKKPILAVFHELSSVVDILQQCQAGQAISFRTGDKAHDLIDQASSQLRWLLELPKIYHPPTDWLAFTPYTAREMTRKLCTVFDRCIDSAPQ